MAYTILWMDGFDANSDMNQKYIQAAEYSGFFGIENLDTPPYGYGRYVRLISNSVFQKTLPSPPYTTLFVHVHIRPTNIVSGEKQWLFFRDEVNGISQFDIRVFYDSVNSYYLLRLYRGSTLVATSSAGLIPNIWNTLSIKYVCNSSSGQCVININNLNVVNFSGNTQNGASAQVHKIRIDHAVSSAFDAQYDNLVYATGLVSDPMLPECRIYGAVVPTSNFSVAFTPSSGTNWSNVNEIPPNDDTSYNFDNTPGDTDLFVCAPPTISGAVLAIKVNYRARKDDAGVRETAAVIRPGSTNHAGGIVQPYTTYFGLGHVWQNNPDTGLAWTPGDLANLRFGYRIHS